MFRFRSVNNIVIAPASTGSESSRSTAVRITDHGNRGVLSAFCFFVRIFRIVAIKLAAPKIDLAPAKCNEKIAISTGGPLWAVFAERGGYTVHPVPAPFSTIALLRSKKRAGTNSHRLMLFIRGKAISGAVNINGDNQLPNPPIITGITRKKIIKKAWAVTNVLYN